MPTPATLLRGPASSATEPILRRSRTACPRLSWKTLTSESNRVRPLQPVRQSEILRRAVYGRNVRLDVYDRAAIERIDLLYVYGSADDGKNLAQCQADQVRPGGRATGKDCRQRFVLSASWMHPEDSSFLGFVIPAEAGIHFTEYFAACGFWIPASAGMTESLSGFGPASKIGVRPRYLSRKTCCRIPAAPARRAGPYRGPRRRQGRRTDCRRLLSPSDRREDCARLCIASDPQS